MARGLHTGYLGLRRVDWVRVVVGDGAPMAEVVGVGHRRPVSRLVPLGVAARLSSEGIPLVVHDHSTPSTSEET